MPGSIMVHKHGNSHVEKQGPGEGPDNKPEAFLLVPMNACKPGQNSNCTHVSKILCAHIMQIKEEPQPSL